MATVTVIVTAYNAGPHIERCLTSVSTQRERDLQIIVIDDASTDTTPDIVAAQVAADSRLTHVRLDRNVGPSEARNQGLALATGDWITFMDSDDYADDTWISDRLHFASERGLDCVVAGHHVDIMSQSGVISKAVSPGLTPGVIPGDVGVITPQFLPSLGFLWNKLYRRSSLADCGVTFRPQLSLYEDFDFNLRFLERRPRIGLIPQASYHYVQTTGPRLTTKRRPPDLGLRAELLSRLESWSAEVGLATALHPQIASLAAAAVTSELARRGTTRRDDLRLLNESRSDPRVQWMLAIGQTDRSSTSVVNRNVLRLFWGGHTNLARSAAGFVRSAAAFRASAGVQGRRRDSNQP